MSDVTWKCGRCHGSIWIVRDFEFKQSPTSDETSKMDICKCRSIYIDGHWCGEAPKVADREDRDYGSH